MAYHNTITIRFESDQPFSDRLIAEFMDALHDWGGPLDGATFKYRRLSTEFDWTKDG